MIVRMSSPVAKLAEATTRDGATRLVLYSHGGSFCLRVNGLQLMHSAASSSELLLGQLAVEGLPRCAAVRVLIGGLGLGFTLKSVLENLGPNARVQVAEIFPQIVEWNQQFMSGLNGHLLYDSRVKVLVADIWEVLTRAGQGSYDAVLLDVDNGPGALMQQQNSRLYDRDGILLIGRALTHGGRATFWSADPAPDFAARLKSAGFNLREVPARFHPTAERCAGTIYRAEKP